MTRARPPQDAATALASPLMTAAEICDLAGGGMHEDTIRRAIQRGELPAYRVGPRAIRVTRQDAERWLLGKPLLAGGDTGGRRT